MNDFEEVTSLIFDLGTFTYKIGTSGNDRPSHTPMPLLGINNDNDMFYSKEEIDSYTNKDMKIIPFMSASHGGIDNMDLFETFFDDILTNHNILNEDMTKHPFLFTEPSIHNRTNRMKLTELMFEHYAIPNLFICKGSVLSSFAFGRTSCVVCDFGHTMMNVVPIHDGMIVKNSIVTNQTFNGLSINSDISKMLNNECDISDSSYDKSMLSYLSLNAVHNIKKIITNDDIEGEFTLPDGKVLHINKKEIKENLLKKILYESNGFKTENNISNMIYNSISKIETDIKREMFNNILICGGNSLLFDSTMTAKIQEDITKRVSMATIVKCTSHPGEDRINTSWIGGSILTSLGSFVQWCVSKEEYEEHGAIIIERKCA